MHPLLAKIVFWLFVAAVIGAANFVSHEFGYQKGVAATKEKNLTDEIASLNKSVSDFAEQTKAAGKLNLELSNTINARKKADAESTKVFTNALAATAHLRFNCVFDDNIMQQLYKAADRADQAASSGFASPLRSGASPPQ